MSKKPADHPTMDLAAGIVNREDADKVSQLQSSF